MNCTKDLTLSQTRCYKLEYYVWLFNEITQTGNCCYDNQKYTNFSFSYTVNPLISLIVALIRGRYLFKNLMKQNNETNNSYIQIFCTKTRSLLNNKHAHYVVPRVFLIMKFGKTSIISATITLLNRIHSAVLYKSAVLNRRQR